MASNQISPEQAHAWLQSGEAQLIDVREAEEFRAGHIAYAASVPLAQLVATVDGMGLGQGRKIIFQCQKGSRGGQACATMAARAGGAEVYNIAGGLEAWRAAGLPVVGGKAASVSIFRQVQMIVGGMVAALVVLGFAGMTVAFALAGLMGLALAVAGATGWCGLALLLNRMPWNR